MTVPIPPHVTIGGIDFLLDEGTENHYVHGLDALASTGQGEVVGIEGITNSKSVFWEVTDWSGGLGFPNWSPQRPWCWSHTTSDGGWPPTYAGVGTRERGQLSLTDPAQDFLWSSLLGQPITSIGWNGRHYTWNGQVLEEFDAFDGCTTEGTGKEEKDWRIVYSRYPANGTAKGLFSGPNMLIAWGEYNNNSYFIGHSGGYSGDIRTARPIIEMPSNTKIYDVAYGNGSLWMLGNYGGTAWLLEADLSSGQLTPRKKIKPPDEMPWVGGSIAYIYGDVLVFPSSCNPQGGGNMFAYVYDVEYDAIHYIHVAGYDQTGILYSGKYDMGYPFEQKLILGVYAGGTDTTSSIVLYGDDGVPHAVPNNDGYNAIEPFSTSRVEMALKAPLNYVAVEGIVVPNSDKGSGVNEYWHLVLRLKDESPGTQLSTNGGTLIEGSTFRDQLWTALQNNDTLDFTDAYREQDPEGSVTVILDSVQDIVARRGEGICKVVLRRLNPPEE